MRGLGVEFGASGVLSALMKRMPGSPPTLMVSDFAGALELRESIESRAKANV